MAFTVAASAQNLKLNDGIIIFKGKEVLKYNVDDTSKYMVSTIEGENLISLQFHDNNTPKKSKDDFFILTFERDGVVLESDKDYYVTQGRGRDHTKNLKRTIQWLVMNNVLNRKGEIDKEELDHFAEKYDEDIAPKQVEGKK